MKVVIPFLMNDENTLDSPKVSGGLERFTQLIYQNFSGEVIPFYYNREDRQKRRVTDDLVRFIHDHNPDLVLSNQDSTTTTTNLQEHVNVPLLWISHTAYGGVFKVPQVHCMHKFMERGGTLAMVSDWQHYGMNRLSVREVGKDLVLNGGLINSAFCSGAETVSDNLKYDVVTIGRTDREKDPFMLHRIGQDTSIKTLVLTSAYELIPDQQIYHDENQHWKYPRETLYNLPYLEVMEKLSESKVYFSTCSRETWGITALEAFSRGVPVILLRSSQNFYRHASEDISPGPEFFSIIEKKNKENFETTYEKLLSVDRKKLSDLTKEKHSKKNWLDRLENLFQVTIDNKKKYDKNSLSVFFD